MRIGEASSSNADAASSLHSFFEKNWPGAELLEFHTPDGVVYSSEEIKKLAIKERSKADSRQEDKMNASTEDRIQAAIHSLSEKAGTSKPSMKAMQYPDLSAKPYRPQRAPVRFFIGRDGIHMVCDDYSLFKLSYAPGPASAPYWAKQEETTLLPVPQD